MPDFSARIRALLQGNPFGEVNPPRPAPPPSPLDGRTVALRILFDYISELTFFRAALGQPVSFRIKRDAMQIEQPGNVNTTLQFPALGIIPGEAIYASIGLTANVEEASKDVFSRGTMIQWQSEYTETFQLEAFASSKAERRAIIAGLEAALVPSEQMYGIRFRMPAYFDQVVCFTLHGRSLDDSDAIRGRRRAKFKIEMRHNVVALVNYVDMDPEMVVETTDNGFDPNPPADSSMSQSLPLDSW